MKNLLKVNTVVIWTDSKVAIALANNKEENRNVFIANRVGEANYFTGVWDDSEACADQK